MEQVFYFDVLRDDKDGELRNTTNLEDRNDIRVFESGDRACFLDVEISIARSLYQVWMRNLDRYSTIELLVDREVDNSEATFAELGLDQKSANLFGEIGWIWVVLDRNHRKLLSIRCIGIGEQAIAWI